MGRKRHESGKSEDFEFELRGDLAMYVMPASKLACEWFSYPFPTYSSLVGVLHEIYYKPGISWHVKEMRIMNPIRYAPIPQRSATYMHPKRYVYAYLYDVRYQIRAYYTLNYAIKDHKYCNFGHGGQIKQRISKGCMVKLGKSSCAGLVLPCEYGNDFGYYDTIEEEMDVFIFHRFSGRDKEKQAEFADVKMVKGIINYEDLVIKSRPWRKMDVSKHNGKNRQGNI